MKSDEWRITVGVCVIELIIRQSHSLKTKRKLLQSIKARMRRQFNVSIAEVGAQDLWQKAVLGISAISNDKRFLNEVLDKALSLISAYPEAEIIHHRLEFIEGC